MKRHMLYLGGFLTLPFVALANANADHPIEQSPMSVPIIAKAPPGTPVVAEINAVIRSTIDPDGLYFNGIADTSWDMDVEATSVKDPGVSGGTGPSDVRIETTVTMEASLSRPSRSSNAYKVKWEGNLRAISYKDRFFKGRDKLEEVSSESSVILFPGESKTILAGNCRKAESVEERCTFEVKITLKPLSQVE
jgi:hypothetical protein